MEDEQDNHETKLGGYQANTNESVRYPVCREKKKKIPRISIPDFVIIAVIINIT